MPRKQQSRIRRSSPSFRIVPNAAISRVLREGGALQLPGFGERSVEKLLRAVGQFRARQKGRFRLSVAEPYAEALVAHLSRVRGVGRTAVAGSYRRRRETVGDLDVLCAADDAKAVSVDSVTVAADRGQVDSLLVVPEAERWGSYEPDLGRVVLRPAREPGDDDLVDLAVVRTLETGGDVFALAPGELDGGVEIAAVLRY